MVGSTASDRSRNVFYVGRQLMAAGFLVRHTLLKNVGVESEEVLRTAASNPCF